MTLGHNGCIMSLLTNANEQNDMNKTTLIFEIQRYIDFGYSIGAACNQVDNLYRGKYTFLISGIMEQMNNA